MKESEYSYSCDRMNRNVRLKNFSIFFDVADGMNLCGRNVAFSVREGMNLIESGRMAKKSRCVEFELKTPEKGKKMVHPAGFEPTTFYSGGRRSIQLSYGCNRCLFHNITLFGFICKLLSDYFYNFTRTQPGK